AVCGSFSVPGIAVGGGTDTGGGTVTLREPTSGDLGSVVVGASVLDSATCASGGSVATGLTLLTGVWGVGRMLAGGMVLTGGEPPMGSGVGRIRGVAGGAAVAGVAGVAGIALVPLVSTSTPLISGPLLTPSTEPLWQLPFRQPPMPLPKALRPAHG